jgi:hypothetical protein
MYKIKNGQKYQNYSKVREDNIWLKTDLIHFTGAN